MKTCNKCGVPKELSEFYAAPKGAQGVMATCKACKITQNADYKRTPAGKATVARYAKSEKGIAVRARATSRYLSTDKGRAMSARYLAKRKAEEPEKFLARTAVMHALQSGALSRGVCEECSASKVEAHHDDYSKPLQVRWLCAKHHKAFHRLLLEKKAGA